MPSRPLAELLDRTLVVVAHPDDECIGAGALLQRIQHATVVFCTDGGPRDEYFWNKYDSREAYASVRRNEAETVAKIAGVKRLALLPIADQELHLNLQLAWEQLDCLVLESKPISVLTLAYEGGHPDHDCCAFLSSVLASRHQLPVWEMPLYHRTNRGPQHQMFPLPSDDIVDLQITANEIERKRQMVNAYGSQAGVLDGFDLAVERFRPQAKYDFSRSPATDLINYEEWQWPIKAKQLCEKFEIMRSQQLSK